LVASTPNVRKKNIDFVAYLSTKEKDRKNHERWEEIIVLQAQILTEIIQLHADARLTSVVNGGVAEIHNRKVTFRIAYEISGFQIAMVNAGEMDIGCGIVNRHAIQSIGKSPSIEMRSTHRSLRGRVSQCSEAKGVPRSSITSVAQALSGGPNTPITLGTVGRERRRLYALISRSRPSNLSSSYALTMTVSPSSFPR
jgi:hypothetical protein